MGKGKRMMPASHRGRVVFGVIVAVTLFITGRNWYCRTLNQRLLEAFEKNDPTQTSLLLRWGANPNATVATGQGTITQTAFYYLTHGRDTVVNQRRDEVVKLYIEHGADIRGTGLYGRNLLRDACLAYDPEILRLLLARRVPVTDEAFDTAFSMWGAQHPLSIYAAQPSRISAQGTLVPAILNKVLQQDSEEVLRLLLAAGQKPHVWQAAWMQDLPTLRVALEHGENVNMSDGNNGTALAIAAQTGNMAAVNLLLAHGADVDADGGRVTPLNGALLYGHAEVARLLLEHGANVNRITKFSGSPLAAAIEYAPQFVPEMLRRGADVHAPDVLTAALRAHNTNLVRDLLRCGAIVNPPLPPAPLTTPARLEAAQVAASASIGRRPRVPVPVLTTTPLAVAVAAAPEYVDLLLQAGADARHANAAILILAARSGHAAVVPALVAAGADVNVKDEQGETALTTALQRAPAMVPILLAHGANANLPNQLQRTPLAIAAMQGDAANVRLLLKQKADPNAATPGGHTALFFARQHKHTEIVALLRQAGARVE